MTNNKETISPELIAAVDEALQTTLGYDLESLLLIAQARNEEDALTINDVVADILEAGDVQSPDDAGFEDAILIGGSSILGEGNYF